MSKIGVVLPVYNQKIEYLIECFLAMEQQTYRDFELVIVLDGPDSSTVEAVFQSQEQFTFPCRVIYRNVNKGIAFSLNEGFTYLKECQYLTWISSDNRQGKDYLLRLSETMDNAPEDTVLVYSMYWPMNANGERHIPEHIWYPEMYSYMNRAKQEILQTCFVGVSFLFKRSAYESCGGYNAKYGKVADYEFWIRLMRCGEFIFIGDVLMEYRYNGPFSITTNTPAEELFLDSMMASVDNRIKHGEIPKVTVVVTSHNHEAYINTCIQSVINQTFADFQIVIVDAGSVDQTMIRINNLHDPRIIALSLLLCTKAEAMNIAMKYVLGEYVLELDGDDWLDPQTLQILVSEMENQSPDTGMLYANRKIWYQNGETLVEGDIYKGIEYRDKYEVLTAMQTHCPRLYRKTALVELGGWLTHLNNELLIADDFMMFLRMAEHYRIHWTDVTLYHQRRHSNNITITDKVTLNRQFKSIVQEMLNRWKSPLTPFYEENDGYITRILLI